MYPQLFTPMINSSRSSSLSLSHIQKQTRTNAVQKESSEIERKAEDASFKNCQPLLPKVIGVLGLYYIFYYTLDPACFI